MTSTLDVESRGGELKIESVHEFGSSMVGSKEFAQLWYSETGTGGLASKTTYLRHGDFKTFQGSIGSEKDIYANKKDGVLRAEKANIHSTLKCNRCNFGKIYILPQVVKHTHAKPGTELHPHADDHTKGVHKMLANMPNEALVMLDTSTTAKKKTTAIDVGAALRGLQKQHTALKDEEVKLTNMLQQAVQQLTRMETLRNA